MQCDIESGELKRKKRHRKRKRRKKKSKNKSKESEYESLRRKKKMKSKKHKHRSKHRKRSRSKSKSEFNQDDISYLAEYDKSQIEIGIEDLQLPLWAQKEHARDENGRQMGDSGYDPSTLWIPEIFNILNALRQALTHIFFIEMTNKEIRFLLRYI